MYKRIAVAVDGSKTSDLALDEAARLARELGSQILLLHVCEELPAMWQAEGMNMMPMPDIVQAIANAGRVLLQARAQQLADQGVAAETKLVETIAGRIGSVIADEARQWGAELLVVGTHGRKGVDHLLMGSVAEQIARSASMPVLLVRAKS